MQYTFSIPGAREKIEQKIKVFTMRRDRKDKRLPEIGETLYLKDGSMWIKAGEPGSIQPILVDGKNPKCTGVWSVSIKIVGQIPLIKSKFFIDVLGSVFPGYFFKRNMMKNEGDRDAFRKLNEFAIMDGWNAPQEMFKFFEDRYGYPVKLNLIYWGEG